MRRDIYKEKKFKEWLTYHIVGAAIILMVVLISILIITMNMEETIYNEGSIKSIPYFKDETIAKLGDIYIRKEIEFETELKNIILGEANRKNKRGDTIYYGVNGKRNLFDLKINGRDREIYMVNNDYVNGVNLTYIKSDSRRKDGESNFNDLISVLSAIYGSDGDRYEEDVIEMFEYLFDISHTYNSESTELYPCEHGCSFCRYYCGDKNVVGMLENGDTTSYYKCDEYMGQRNEYGLMYQPFIIKNRYNYPDLVEMADNEGAGYSTYNMTIYEYEEVVEKITRRGSKEIVNYVVEKKRDKVDADDIDGNDIFGLYEPMGYCSVCSENETIFNTTTKEIGGCCSHVSCYHGKPLQILEDPEDEELVWIEHYVGDEKDKEEEDCNHVAVRNPRCTCEDERRCKAPLYDLGFYTCEGHNHYACPGHIVVTCFGHTTLNLNVNILYYEAIIDELKKVER